MATAKKRSSTKPKKTARGAKPSSKPAKKPTKSTKKGAKKAAKRSAKSPAKKPTKATSKPAKSVKAALPIVAIVGAAGAGVSTLAGRLANGAKFTAHRATCVIEGTKVCVWDVPGQSRDDRESDAEMKRFEELLDALEAAAVIVHVIDASDTDAERVGCRTNRWIYGSWYDLGKHIVTVFNKRDLAADRAVLDVLRETWPDAIDVSATKGDGVDALSKRVAKSASAKVPELEDAPTVEGSLVDLQLALIEHTQSKTFDGPAIARRLREWLADETILSAQFLREANVTYTSEGLDREDGGLLFLGSLSKNTWNANTIHVVTDREAHVEAALAAMGARQTERSRERVVTAHWSDDGLRSIAPPDAPTAQAIQLEIIRRAGYNAFRGDLVHAWLVAHPTLWQAAAFGRLRAKTRDGERVYESFTRFNTVFALAESGWNADELWVVVPDEATANKLRRIGEWHWFADNIVTLTEDEARRVAGVRAPAQVIEFWWD